MVVVLDDNGAFEKGDRDEGTGSNTDDVYDC